MHTYLLTYVPVRGGKEDIASAQAVHVDDGVGGQLHLLLEAEAPRRLSSEYLVSTSSGVTAHLLLIHLLTHSYLHTAIPG